MLSEATPARRAASVGMCQARPPFHMKLHIEQVNHVENGPDLPGGNACTAVTWRHLPKSPGDDRASARRRTNGISVTPEITNATTFRLGGSPRSAPPDRRWRRQRPRRQPRHASTPRPTSPGQIAAASERTSLGGGPNIPTTKRRHRRSAEALVHAPIAQAASSSRDSPTILASWTRWILSSSSDERSMNRLSMGSIVSCNGWANALGRRQIG